MAIRVGINGSAASDATFCAPPRSRGPTSSSSPSTTSPTRRRSRTCSVRLHAGPSRAPWRPRATAWSSAARRSGRHAERDPAKLPWRTRRRPRARVHRLLHRPAGRGPPRRGREEGHHLGAGQGRRPHDRARRQRRRRTTAKAPSGLERVVHHELPRARRARCCTTTFGIERGLMTTIARLHERPALLDMPHERPPPRPRRGALDHPDLDRRGAARSGS